MEGLIPFVYKAIVQYKNGDQGFIGSFLNESPSGSYMRLPGDSVRFQILQSDLGLPSCSSPSSATKRTVSAGAQSLDCHLITSRQALK